MDIMPYIWLVVVIVMSVAEAVTAQMISIWFVLGAIAALIISIFTDSITIQILSFILVTFISLLVTKPLVRKAMMFKKEDTNVGRYIGKIAVVTDTIDNRFGTGQVKINGLIWTARSSDDSIIPIDSDVLVERIEGVKLIVTKLKNN